MTITIKNVANEDYTDDGTHDLLDDQLPAGLVYDTTPANAPTISCVGGSNPGSATFGFSSPTTDTLQVTHGTLPARETCTITATVTATMSAIGKYTNTIPVGALHTQDGSTNTNASTADLNVTSLSIAKTFNPSTFGAGQTSLLTITITNPSPNDFTSATLSDSLPTSPNTNLFFTGTPAPSTTCGSGSVAIATNNYANDTIQLTGGTIPKNNSCTITATVTTLPTAPVADYTGTNANTIPAKALNTNELGTNALPATADVHVTSLQVLKTYDGNSSSTVSYPNASKLVITITNPTSAALTGISFTDALDSKLEIMDHTSTPSYSDPATTCNAVPPSPALTATAGSSTISLSGGSVAASSSCTVTVYVRPKQGTSSGSYTNTINAGDVTATGPIGNHNPTQATLNVNTVSVSKAFQYSGFEAGQTDALTITLTNSTGSDLHITSAHPLSDTLPINPNTNLYFTGTPTTDCAGGVVSLSGAPTTRTVTLTGLVIPGATIPANGSCHIFATVTTDPTAPATDYVGADANTIPIGALITSEGPTNTNAPTAPVSVYTNGAGITASKTFNSNSINPNGTSTMILTFQAPPDKALTQFAFTDDLPTTATDNVTTPATLISAINHVWYIAVTQNTCGGTTTLNAVGGATATKPNELVYQNGSINIGNTCTVHVTVTSDMGSGPGIQYKNDILPTNVTTNEGRSITSAISDTLAVHTNSVLQVSKAFYPTIVNPGGFSTLKITLTNTNTNALVNVTLTDVLPFTSPNGVIVAQPPNQNYSTDCNQDPLHPTATITFPDTHTISMQNGYVPAKAGTVNGICTINVDVQGLGNLQTYTNTIHTYDVVVPIPGTSSTMGAEANASADITVRNLTLEVVKGFNPQLVYGSANSQMSIILRNPNPSAELTGIQFTDNMWLTSGPNPYPAGEMILADPPAFDPSACNPPSGPAAAMTGTAGTSTFTFSGGYLAPGTQCTITLNVTMLVNGNRTNTIPIGAVTSFNGASNGTATSASLTNLAGASVTKVFTPDTIPAGLNNYSILTITIRNTTSLQLTQLGLVDSLPTGLQVAGGSAPAPTNACGGTLAAAPGATTIQLSHASLLKGFANCDMTIPVTGGKPGQYTNTIPPGNLTAKENPEVHQGATATLTLTPYSLGNRVWYDTNNNGVIDTGEVGVGGVTVNLYQDNGSTPGVWDLSDTLVGSTTTDSSGYYRFDNLSSGDYIVVIPHSNFSTGATPLAGYLSSGTSMTGTTVTDAIGPSPNDDVDSDDNGVSTFSGMAENYVSSRAVTLGPGGSEPIGETDKPSPNPAGEAVDNQSNLTVDFGFYRLQLGDQIFADLNNNGNFDSGTDSPLPGATVELFASNGTTQINVGPDGILGTADDASGGVTTGANGQYHFFGMPAGQYIVKVLPTGYPSTKDTYSQITYGVDDTAIPDENVDNNDNGVGSGTSTVFSNVVTLKAGYSGNFGNNTITNGTGTTYNPTVDFGYVTSLGKKIVSTSEPSIPAPNVTIGETITYEVDMTIPPLASLPNTVLLDTLDSGLAFVDCESVNLPTNVTSSTYTGSSCNTKTGATAGATVGSNPLIANSGRNIAFDFGTITNGTSSTQLIKVQYKVIVLDVLANQNGDSLLNHVTWAYGTAPNTTTYTTNAPPVTIVEPKLTVTKNATPTTVSVPSIVTYTIDIAHSSQSQAGAFDVVLNDHIPDGLTYDPASLNVTGSATLTSQNFDATTNTLQLRWNQFPLNDNAHVTFQAAYIGPGSDTNTATVEWMSLAIDPRTNPPLSAYDTIDSTVRYFNTGSGNGDSYGAASSVTISPPGHRSNGSGPGQYIEPGSLPGTGFAPGKLTNIPSQPSSQAYADLGNLWLEIPRLKVKMPIVGIPLNKDGSWDLTWLGDQAGYLNGTAYPTLAGNSVLTAHVYMSNGQPGPFVSLATLQWGDQVIVHFDGQKYIYQVTENKVVLPQDISAIKHETLPWLTLLTCKDYNASTNTYAHRVLVGAVLVKVEPDTGSNSGRK